MRSGDVLFSMPQSPDLQPEAGAIPAFAEANTIDLTAQANEVALGGLQAATGVETFAANNDIFEADKPQHPTDEIPQRVYMTKTTLTETAGDDK